METNEGVGSFSDCFSPEKLCGWLAAMFEANGLELKEDQRRIFIEDEINGLAFRNLKDADLKEMGFKRGPRMNILDIISSLSVEKNSPMEEHDGTSKSASITPSAPAIGCTMSFSPKMTSVSGSEPSEGTAPACMPYKGHLWRKDKLVVELHNKEYLSEWGLTPETFLECANRWSTRVIEGDNFIPKFEFKDNSPSDIIVELNKLGKIESDIGYHVSRPAARVFLDLRHNDQMYREHLIGHEFGHVLGLGHEHQRSKLWKLVDKFIDKDKMKIKLGNRYDHWREDKHAEDGGSTENYDPDSIMHYWFLREWLRDDYSDEATVAGDPALNEEARQALLGILKRDGNVVICPSPMDLKFLSDQYKNARGVLDMPQVPHKRNVPLTGRGSDPAPKRIRVDYGSRMKSLNDKPTMEELLNFKDGTNNINIPSRISTKYFNFGIQLLRDFEYVKSQEQQYNRDCEKINTHILQEWLGGSGREPRSWATLVEVLKDIQLGELASRIERSIMQSSNED